MSYYFIPKPKSPFTVSLWIRWIILSLIGWGSFYGSIIYNFYSLNILYILPMLVISLIVIGFLQWINIRNLVSWSNSWIRASIIGIPLGIIYVIILIVIIGPPSVGIGLLVNSYYGVILGIVSTTLTVSVLFIVVTHYNGKLTKILSEKINIKKLHIFEQIVLVKDSTSAAIILNTIFLFADVFVAIIIGGLTFALLTGFGIKEIGLSPIGSNMKTVAPID